MLPKGKDKRSLSTIFGASLSQSVVYFDTHMDISANISVCFHPAVYLDSSGNQSVCVQLISAFVLLLYRGAAETQLVWNPSTSSADNVEAPFCKFCTTHTLYTKPKTAAECIIEALGHT